MPTEIAAFGQGQSDYVTQAAEVTQDIQTRLSCFLGDCFFDLGAGIDWFGFTGSKNEIALNLAINAVILNTPYVSSIVQTSLNLTSNRMFSVSFTVNTSFGEVITANTTVLITPSNYLTTEDSDVLTTEDGDGIII